MMKKSMNVTPGLLKIVKSARDDRTQSSEIEKIKIDAFSYCVEALTEYEMGNMEKALAVYRTALDMYENNNLLDDQYARAKKPLGDDVI